MINAGRAEAITTECTLAIVFVSMTDGCLQFIVDYCRLNNVAKRDSYHIPKMDERIDSLGETQVFSALDSNSSYWQIEMDDKNVDKAAFVTQHGLFCYATMPCGLKTAPETCQ